MFISSIYSSLSLYPPIGSIGLIWLNIYWLLCHVLGSVLGTTDLVGINILNKPTNLHLTFKSRKSAKGSQSVLESSHLSCLCSLKDIHVTISLLTEGTQGHPYSIPPLLFFSISNFSHIFWNLCRHVTL